MRKLVVAILALGLVGFLSFRAYTWINKPKGKVISIQGEFKLPSLDTIPKGDKK